MRSAVLALALMTIGTTEVSGQSNPAPDRFSLDVAGGATRYGPHAFGGLEMAMTRWLALRTEAMFSPRNHPTLPDTRLTGLSLGAVASLNRDGRFSPYLLGGHTTFLSQGNGLRNDLLAGAGLRTRFGAFQPFFEYRRSELIGHTWSLGLRF